TQDLKPDALTYTTLFRSNNRGADQQCKDCNSEGECLHCCSFLISVGPTGQAIVGTPLRGLLDGILEAAKRCTNYGLAGGPDAYRSEEHTSELQSLRHLVC